MPDGGGVIARIARSVAPAPPRSLKIGTLVPPLVKAFSDGGSIPPASTMTATAAPPSTDIIGPTIPGRWWSWLRERRVYCYDPRHGGHLMTYDSGIFDHGASGFKRCKKWVDAERRECGRLVYLCAIRGGGVIVAEVHETEFKILESLESATRILDYLGIWRAQVPS